MTNIYKHFAFLSIALYWFTTSFILIKFYDSKERTISQHIAKHKAAGIIWSAAVFVYIILMSLFFWKWFIDAYELTHVFSVVTILSIVGFTLGLIVQDTSGLAHIIHKYAAYTASWLLMIMLALISMSPIISTPQSVICWGLFIIMFIIWIKLLLNQKNRKNYLIYQIFYYACFHVGLLTAVYLR